MQGEREGEGIEACPWCGGRKVIPVKLPDSQVYVVCVCGAAGPFSLTRADAISAWNRVAALEERARELEAVVEKARMETVNASRAAIEHAASVILRSSMDAEAALYYAGLIRAILTPAARAGDGGKGEGDGE